MNERITSKWVMWMSYFTHMTGFVCVTQLNHVIREWYDSKTHPGDMWMSQRMNESYGWVISHVSHGWT